MVDYSNKKIPIFPDINSTPIAPTSDRGMNVGYICERFNTLITGLENDLTVFNSTLSEITSTYGNFGNSLASLQTQVEQNRINLENIDFDSITLDSTHANNTTIYLDTVNGNDDNNTGLSANSPFKTLAKVENFLASKYLPDNITVVIKGSISRAINLTKVIPEKPLNSKLNFTGDSGIKWQLTTKDRFVIYSGDLPLILKFKDCELIADEDSLKLINLLGKVRFFNCSFTTTQTNTDCILRCLNTEIELFDTLTSNTFTNNFQANLDSAIKLDGCKAKIENCTVSGVNIFCSVENRSLVYNTAQDNQLSGGKTEFSVKSNSKLISNRFSKFGTDLIELEPNSSLNDCLSLVVPLSNPLYNASLPVYENRHKKFTVLYRGSSNYGDSVGVDFFVDNDTLVSRNYVLLPGEDLRVTLSGSGTTDYIALKIELHEIS